MGLSRNLQLGCSSTYSLSKWLYVGYLKCKWGLKPTYKYLVSPMSLQVGPTFWYAFSTKAVDMPRVGAALGSRVSGACTEVLFGKWRLMGFSNYLKTGLITLSIIGLTYLRPVRETIRRLTSPVISGY